MRISLNTAKGAYIGVWIIAAAWAALTELDCMPSGFIDRTPKGEYALHLTCITLTLTCTWFALRMFALKSIRHKIDSNPASLATWNLYRTAIMTVAIFMNLFTYYGLMSSTTPLFCLLITLAAFVFCWPKTDE